MKVTIDEAGCLTVVAETGIEHYALNRWFDDWRENRVTMRVVAQHPNVSFADASRLVEPKC